MFINRNKVIEEWDDRGNRQSIDRQEHEIEQISKAIYQASELLLDKEGSLNIISGNGARYDSFENSFPKTGLFAVKLFQKIS